MASVQMSQKAIHFWHTELVSLKYPRGQLSVQTEFRRTSPALHLVHFLVSKGVQVSQPKLQATQLLILATKPDPQLSTQKPLLMKKPALQVLQLVELVQIEQLLGQARHSLIEFENLPTEHLVTHFPFSRNKLEAHLIHLVESQVSHPVSQAVHFPLTEKKPLLQEV